MCIARKCKRLVGYSPSDDSWYTTPKCCITRVYLYIPLFIVLGGDKKGKCPILVRPKLCVSDVDECFIDWDCVGNRTCCSNGCYRVCVSPSVGPGSAVGSVQLQAAAGTHILGLYWTFLGNISGETQIFLRTLD